MDIYCLYSGRPRGAAKEAFILKKHASYMCSKNKVEGMSIQPLKLGRGRPRKVVIPQTFQVLGHQGNVYLVSPQELLKLSGDSDELDGYYDHSHHSIYLSTSLSGSELEQTYLHELVHCILFSAGYSEYSDDEDFVDLVSELLYQITKTTKGRLRN